MAERRGYWGGVGGEIRDWANQLPGIGWLIPERQVELPERPPLGALGKQAAQQQAKAFSSMMGQMLAQNIAGINREYGQAGRFASGQRLGAVREAGTDISRVLGNILGQSQMDLYKTNVGADIAYRGLEQDYLWKQAQLQQGGQMDWGGFGQNAVLIYLMQHPEALAALGL